MLRTYTRILPVLALAGAAGLLFVGRGWAAEVWVTNMKSATVQVIDPQTMQVVATILADKGAHNVTLSKDGKLAFVANVGACGSSKSRTPQKPWQSGHRPDSLSAMRKMLILLLVALLHRLDRALAGAPVFAGAVSPRWCFARNVVNSQ